MFTIEIEDGREAPLKSLVFLSVINSAIVSIKPRTGK